MKILVATLFLWFAFATLAQHVVISNGQSSFTINHSLSMELADSFFKTAEIVVKLIDDDGKTIPCTKGTL